MKKNLFINGGNICGIFSNLSRAYEIALLGGFKIRLIQSNNVDDHLLSTNDLYFISEYFDEVEFIFDGDDFEDVELDSIVMHIELGMPEFDSIISTRNSVSLDSVVETVKNSRDNVLPEFKLSESGKALLSTAFRRLKLDLNQLNSIAEISRVIAKLHGSKEIKLEYLAEAIQYLSYERE
jgi:hypothetical protein